MKIDKILLITCILLCLLGLLMVYSSSNVWAVYKFNDSFHYFKYQLIYVIIGFILLFLFLKIDIGILYKYSNYLLFFSIFLLILVLIPNVGVVRNGSRSWFSLMGFSIQPSEIMKISLIIFASKYISNNINKVKKTFYFLYPILFILFFIFFLIMLEPDFGTGFIIVISILFMIFISGVNIKFFAFMGVFGLIGAFVLVIIAPYRMDRIISFINPWNDALGSGFQIIQSLYAIGPGGILGRGLFNSRQKYFYLPEPQTDFIFSIISEEFGILGAFIVCLLFSILFYRCIKISLECDNSFNKFLCFGLSFQIIIQCVLNLCVVIGLVPVTGVTLPFISYGGSSLITSMISIGIILNIGKK